jgi:hypothetical protein
VTATRYDGMIHAFCALGGIIDDGCVAIAQVAEALHAAFEA